MSKFIHDEDREESIAWKVAKPLWKLLGGRAKQAAAAPYLDDELLFVIDYPRQWKTSRARLTIEGWCFLLTGRRLTGVRAMVGGTSYPARNGIERPDVAREECDSPAARESGFSVEVPLAVGSSTVRLEAVEEGGEWRSFAEREILREATRETDVVPLPPHRLMVAVAGHDDDDEFRRSRLGGPTQMLHDFVAAGIDPINIHDALDFGCGCGRFLAGWLVLQRPMRLRGCDYNAELVDWCNENLPGVEVRQNRLGEPLPYDAGSFDLVYVLSVFTHLTLREQQQLVREFRRVVRPGGFVYVTFHGEPFHERLFAQMKDGHEQFRETGFLIGDHVEEGTNQCWTLHSPEHLVALFEGFRPVKHFRASERGPTDVASWQDSMIFQAVGQPDGEPV